MGWYPWGRKETPVLRKIKKYNRIEKKRYVSKNKLAFLVLAIIVGLLWYGSSDYGFSAFGAIMMLTSLFLIYRETRKFFRKDPVDEQINDLEQQFWDIEIQHKTERRKEKDP